MAHGRNCISLSSRIIIITAPPADEEQPEADSRGIITPNHQRPGIIRWRACSAATRHT